MTTTEKRWSQENKTRLVLEALAEVGPEADVDTVLRAVRAHGVRVDVPRKKAADVVHAVKGGVRKGKYRLDPVNAPYQGPKFTVVKKDEVDAAWESTTGTRGVIVEEDRGYRTAEPLSFTIRDVQDTKALVTRLGVARLRALVEALGGE